MNDIDRELNLNISNICMCCKGNYKSSKGFKWKYL